MSRRPTAAATSSRTSRSRSATPTDRYSRSAKRSPVLESQTDVRPVACRLDRIDYDGAMLGNGVSVSRVKELVALTQRSRTPWLQFEQPEFRNAYNQRPFLVRHRLAEHPLF